MLNVASLSRWYNGKSRVTHVASSPSAHLSTRSRSCTPLTAKNTTSSRSSRATSLFSTKAALTPYENEDMKYSIMEEVVFSFMQACFQGERGNVKGKGIKVTLEELFQYYRIYCAAYWVYPDRQFTKKRFTTTVKKFFDESKQSEDQWKDVCFAREDCMVVHNMVPTPSTENIFMKLREALSYGHTMGRDVPEALRTLEPARFENKQQWMLPKDEAASPVTVTDGLKVGFIRMGIMGVPMTLNFLEAGASVTAWSRSPGNTSEMQAAGAKVAGSLEELAKESGVIFGMLADPAAALDAARQLSKSLTPGATYVELSTVDASTAQQIAKLVRGAGGRYLGARVVGSKGSAEEGTLIFLTEGDRDAFDAVSPMLDVMGKAKYSFGEDGMGA